ncbi:unnamed protein product [Ambrosiozyma monospora]|uniref:Unnamed protein product n=1 Tax=Ambrosiozyma monospora TaxID=43982 RepID=A0ACB5U3H9_AMBMO|nr:unnamed protein product [Ambrosiozyma monospora]
MTVSSLKDSTGEPLVSVEQLVQRIDSEIAKDEDELKKKDLDSETKDRVQRRRQRRLDRRSKRKTMSRLRRQERELKRRDAEKYGDERGFIGWFFKLVWKIFKTILYVVLFAVVCYIGVIVYRVYRDKQKRKTSRGLL